MAPGCFPASMKSKLTLLAIATAVLLPVTSHLRAADPVPPTPPANPPAEPGAKRERAGGGQRGDRLEMMKEQLSLTPEQVEKIKPILEKDREKLTALRSDEALTQEQKRAKMQEIIKASAEEIKPILTPEQVEKWKAQMEKRRAEREKQ